MDIRKWLDETVQPEAPREPNNLHQTAEPAKRKRRRRSDSSLLDPRPLASSPHKPAEDSADEALQATCSDSSRSSRYARKPRRKTRPERYEPQYAPGPHAHHDRKDKSKKSRRKPRRKKGEKAPGVMQTFQATNISGDRLTLKPREQLGLFNKGRTSTAIKGRGLPDLVFSEMKFLQQHKDEPEPVPRTDASKKKRKKDNEQMKEGEISAFFTSAQPALADKDTNTLPQHPVPKAKRRRRDQSSVDDIAIPTVEATGQASYLGSRRRHTEETHPSYPQSNLRQSTRDTYHAAQQGPTVRFADQSHYGPVMPNFAGPSIYEQQAQRQRSHMQRDREEEPLQSPYHLEQNNLDQGYQMGYDDGMEHDDENWEGLLEEPLSYSLDGDSDIYGGIEAHPGNGIELVQDSRPENDTVAPGFWRPNKLY
ncbi:uncharacterized protein J4E92_009054 [Alternaria infectoria]|uniref:uncharacterized protein n=1 Tax=Alternaria infectoria TaxID=45303 RepID=UPI00221E8CA2|nr:uncharacterized protein J4E92_009054 [Alternaria infectoria]KAI4917660.1 hypothetical protein J4E92_009054 [Alternaria infectoria]